MSPNPPVARDETDCQAGTTFYFCVANQFRGCCSTDPCALRSCPDGLRWKVSATGSDAQEATPTPTPTGDGDGDGDGLGRERDKDSTSSRPSPTTSTRKSATITDSGITHTIPNNSIVTITRHTTITTGRQTTTSSDTFEATPSPTDVPLTGTPSATSDIAPAPSSTDAEAASSSSPAAASPAAASPLSTGIIVGIAIGSVVAIAVLAVLAFALLRRRRNKQAGSDTASVVQQDTGTQASSDPFAPFGGRADQPEDPYRPPSGAFEMDGTSAAPIELPAVSASSPGPSTQKGTRLEPVQEVTAADPRANLTPAPADDGKPVYVNHWNQYKNLG